MANIDRNLRRKLFYTSQSARLSRCFAPSSECEEPAIRAHSVQNSTVMGLLHLDGHVKTPAFTLNSDDTFSIYWRDIGKNLATTFEGFCAVHDTALFKSIDVKPLDTTDAEQLFLYAYRAVARELHASMEATMKMQAGYHGRIVAGLDSGTKPEEAGMRSLGQMMIAYSTYNYKIALDRAFSDEKFGVLKHDVIRLTKQAPALAVSACFDLDNRHHSEDPPRISLNILPTSGDETVVILSYTEEDTLAAHEYIHGVIEAEGTYQKYLISRLLLTHAENFIVAPALFNTWSQTKKDKILDFFLKTMRFNSSEESEHLYLF